MRTQQRETAQLMDPRNVGYKPAGSGMAPCTIQSDSRLMNIGMAIIAVSLCFPENQGRMTKPAVCFCMLSGEGQFCGTVIKRIYRFIKVPPLRAMADVAAELEILSVRMTCFLFQEQEEEAD
jgi:hypothetical protein